LYLKYSQVYAAFNLYTGAGDDQAGGDRVPTKVKAKKSKKKRRRKKARRYEEAEDTEEEDTGASHEHGM
jgi:hypothetical protein